MKIELQEFLFENLENRNALRNWSTRDSSLQLRRIHVHRNHSFEPIAAQISSHLALAGIRPVFTYSDYDDSFSLLKISSEADLVIFWVDLSRYPATEANDFIRERIAAASAKYNVPILLVTTLGNLTDEEFPVPHLSTSKLEIALGAEFIDERLEKISGTRISAKAQTLLTTELGLRYLPALFGLQIKCLILDLDNTLYKGVLGEDGLENLVLTPGHKQLQKYLKTLANQGILLCIASKNDARDVDALFVGRPDFPLKRDDFFTVAAGWMPKHEIVSTIESLTNTHHSSFLFIDDNVGEIYEFSRAYPGINFLHAKDEGALTLFRLEHFPGIMKLVETTAEDSLRKNDLLANAQRRSLQEQLSPEEYLKSLDVELTVSLNKATLAKRLFELCNKTNQFIFSYARFTENQVVEFMESSQSCVVSVSMRDKLSDSGVIAASFISFDSHQATVRELVVSCRALGRGLDEIIVKTAIKAGLELRKATSLSIPFTIGERNEPALLFKEKFLSEATLNDILNFQIPSNLLKITIEN